MKKNEKIFLLEDRVNSQKMMIKRLLLKYQTLAFSQAAKNSKVEAQDMLIKSMKRYVDFIESRLVSYEPLFEPIMNKKEEVGGV